MLQAFTNYSSTVNQGLQNQVVYRVWLVAEDALGNVQTSLSSVTVKTMRTTPPLLEYLLVQYNAPSSVYIEVCFSLVAGNCPAQLAISQSRVLLCYHASFGFCFAA